MANYNENITTGDIKSWQRTRQIILDNPHDSSPVVTCYEYLAKLLPDGEYSEKSIGNLSYTVTDPTVEIPLVDLETYEEIGETITAVEIWQAIASVYFWLAKQRDGVL